MANKYPIYVISKGRFENCLIAKFLIKDNVDFKLVVEPQEADEYAKRYGTGRILILPFSNLGMGSIPARNWVWEYSLIYGHKRHWILDDNIRGVMKRYNGYRLNCNSKILFDCCEDFIDRYENIAIAGINYHMFVPDKRKVPEFHLNNKIYSFMCILNEIPFRWRGRYNEDTDLCLQVLSNNWCTLLFNNFQCQKMATMKMKGGNSDELYKDDGRLKMARSLERMWPGIVKVIRRFKRPQHYVDWTKFKTPLIRRTDIDWTKIKGINEFGAELKILNPIKSKELKKIIKK